MNDMDEREVFLQGDDEADANAARYESMPIEQVHAELHRHGIDPADTIAAVKALVNEKLRKCGGRSLHLEAAFLVLLSAVVAIHYATRGMVHAASL